jgi:uncharacterized protein YuzE
MKITYDSEADAVYIRFAEGAAIQRTRFDDEGIAVDFDVRGRLVGIEILYASVRIDDVGALKGVAFEDITKEAQKPRHPQGGKKRATFTRVLMGRYRDALSSSEEFARRKEEEIRLESRSR